MNGLSVVIPSRTAGNLRECVKAINSANEECRIIVVDDGVDFSQWIPLGSEDLIVSGGHPFIFSRNVNVGIAAAGSDDVIVMNDDALLETEGGFTALQKKASEWPEIGLFSATCNNVGNPNMHPHNQIHLKGLRWEPRMVCFTCVLIPRRTIDAVGLLDERFTDYGMEDDDYCFRVRNAGLKIGIYDGCFVDHSKLKSTFRSAAAGNNAPGDFRPNMRRFIQKWGVDNWGRGRAESDFADLFPSEVRESGR